MLYLIDYMQKVPKNELKYICKTAHLQLVPSLMHLVNYFTPFR